MKNKIITIIGLFLVLALSLTLVSAITIKNVQTTPSQVEPGEKVSVKVEVENNLAYDVENVEVALQLDSVSGGIPLSPATSSVDYKDAIDEDDDSYFEFDLIADADADAGVYKIPVLISFNEKDKTERQTKTFTISVTINSKPNLLLNLEDILLKNQKNKLSVRITNIGLSKAKFLEVELGPSAGYDILSSNRVYIGDLDSDDFDGVDFQVYLKSSGKVIIPVNLKYRDALNNEIVETKAIQAKVYSQEEAIELGLISKSTAMIYVYIVIALLVIWFIWRKWKKRKKKKNNGGN